MTPIGKEDHGNKGTIHWRLDSFYVAHKIDWIVCENITNFLWYYLGFLSIAVIRHWPKATMGAWGFPNHAVYSPSWRKMKQSAQGKNLEVGTWRQRVIQRAWANTFYWLVPYGLKAYFSYTTQDHQGRSDTAHSGLVPVMSLIDEENSPPPKKNSLQICLQEIWWSFCHSWVPFSRWFHVLSCQQKY